MKTIILRNKQTGELLDNNELVHFAVDVNKQYPIRRIVRWALIQTAKIMDADCAGMEGEGDWGIDTFWDYFKEFYPELLADTHDDGFEEILIDKFCL